MVRSREVSYPETGCCHDRISLKCDRRLGSIAADRPDSYKPIFRSFKTFKTIFDSKTSYGLVNRSPGWDRGPESIKRCNLTSIGNPIVEIRRSYDRLISTMGFPIPVRHLYIESGPWILRQVWNVGPPSWMSSSALLTLCVGNPPATGGFLSHGTSNACFDVSFDVSIKMV